jgi:uncharacterized glyoxalase superfamily protein PhnB
VIRKCVPMIHVPDVRATVEWYQGIGFEVVQTAAGDEDGLSFAMLSFGTSEVMFSSGGEASTARRREVDLYVYTEDVDGLHDRLKDRADVVEQPHDTFYGMRELIIRDLNRFWITFGEHSAGALLLQGIAAGDLDAVVKALQRSGCSADLLTVAWSKATHAAQPNDAIVRAIESRGGARPRAVPDDHLHSLEGSYARDNGSVVRVVFRDGMLHAVSPDDYVVHLLPLGDTTFRPLEFPETLVTFGIESGRPTGLTFAHGANREHHRRV